MSEETTIDRCNAGERVGAAVYPARPAAIPRRRSPWLLPIAAVLAACATVPITGRRTFVPFPVTEDTPLGAQAYQEILASEKPITSGPQAKLVTKVMDRLVATLGGDDPGFTWEVTLLDAPDTPNAFCLPGGKMAVYTGILPITQDEAGLAVVMGHEIGHAIARHGASRVGQEMVKSGVLEAVQIAKPDWAAYSELGLLGAELLFSLPWGREQELESDHIGLILMARAGYDPRVSVEFWSRMKALSGPGGPAWLSTHPSNDERIAQLEQRMPEALAIYQKK